MSPISQIRVRPAPRNRFIGPPGAMKPWVPKTVIVSTACSTKAIAPSQKSQRGIRGQIAEAEHGDGAHHRQVRPCEQRPPEVGDIEDRARRPGRQSARMQGQRSPDPCLHGRLDNEGGSPEEEDVAGRARQQAADDPGKDSECKAAEGGGPGIGPGGVLVGLEPFDHLGRAVGGLWRRAERDAPDEVEQAREDRGEDQDA